MSLYYLLEFLHAFLIVAVWKHVEDFVAALGLKVTVVVEALTTETTSEVEILLHHGHAGGMDGTQVGVLEETGQVALSCLLKSQEGCALEAELGINTVTDGADEALEGGLRKHEVSGLLVLLDFSDGDSAGSESELALLLDATLSSSSLLAGLVSLACLGTSGACLGNGALDGFLTCNLLSWHL